MTVSRTRVRCTIVPSWTEVCAPRGSRRGRPRRTAVSHTDDLADGHVADEHGIRVDEAVGSMTGRFSPRA